MFKETLKLLQNNFSERKTIAFEKYFFNNI